MNFWRQQLHIHGVGVALDPLSGHPGWENDRALLLGEIPMTEKSTPGILKCSGPGLVTREEAGRRAAI